MTEVEESTEHPRPAEAPVLDVADLRVSFPSEAGRVQAVRGLSLRVHAGEVLGIVGESGSGKSVSALAAMGLLDDSARVSGSIRFAGTELIGRSDAELSRIRGRRIAMVFQDPLSSLTPVFTVGDQLAEALLVHAGRGMTKAAAAARAVELLDLVGIPNAAARAKNFPHEFSGGMRQRVMIAMAIANDPDLIIADEPTTALDVTVQAQVLRVLATARQLTGAAIVLITHDLGVLAGFADRLMVMYAGRAVETGAVDEIYRAPRMPYTLGLLGSIPRLDAGRTEPLVPIEGQPPSPVRLPPGCPFAPRCPLAEQRCRAEEPPLSRVGDAADGAAHLAACVRTDAVAAAAEQAPADQTQTAGTPGVWSATRLATEVFGTRPAVQPERTAPPRARRDTVLEVRELVRSYPVISGTVFRRRTGTVRAVDGVSFDLVAGETLGLVGESGCGKTTTLTQILDLVAPVGGSVSVLGHDVAALDAKTRKQIRGRMQVVFQDPMASLDPRLPVRDILAEPMQVHGVPKSAIAERVGELLDLVGLRAGDAARYPAEFSGGQRQRICIARALALRPSLVLLDEPVSALDVSIQAGVLNLLDELQVRLGLSYLFVAHDLSVVRHVADRVAVMHLGKIVEIGDVREVFGSPAHPYTQALLSAIPIPDPVTERQRERIILTGDLPSPADPPSGCRFRTRCVRFAALPAEMRERCIEAEPPREQHGTDHEVACHYAQVRPIM